MSTPITEVMVMSDTGDCLWTPGGLIGQEELGVGDLSGLEERFREWSVSIEPQWPDFSGVDWAAFHKRGLELSRELKAAVGQSVRIVYRKTPADPGYETDEYTVIE